MKLNTSLVGVNQLLYATYFGGGGETRAGNGSLDLGNGVVAIVGSTTSNSANGDIPLKNAFQAKNSATGNGMIGFLVLINTTQTGAASLQCGTYFGGSGGDEIVSAVTYDAGDPTNYRIILGGRTNSATDFPTLNPIQPYVGASGEWGAEPGRVSLHIESADPQSDSIQRHAGVFDVHRRKQSARSDPRRRGFQPRLLEDDRISAVAVDANHTIYAVGVIKRAGWVLREYESDHDGERFPDYLQQLQPPESSISPGRCGGVFDWNGRKRDIAIDCSDADHRVVSLWDRRSNSVPWEISMTERRRTSRAW